MYRLFLHQCFPILLILINKFMVCCGELDVVKKHDGSKLYKSPTMFVYGNGYKKICSYCPRQYFSDVEYHSEECMEQYIQHNKSLNISGNNRTYHRICRQFRGEKDFMNDVDCTFPLDIQNGNVSLVHNYLGNNDYQVDSRRPVIGTVIEMVCNSGYTPVNDTIAVCQVEKSKPRWSQELACKRTGCFRDILEVTNGEVKCTNISNKELIANDTICSVKCYDGFEARISTTTCLEGEWSEKVNCSPKTDTSVNIVIVAVVSVMILIGIFVVIIIGICCNNYCKKRNKKDYVNVSVSLNAEDPVVQIPDGTTSENPGEQNPHGEASEVVADNGSCDSFPPSASPPTPPSISGFGMSQSDTSSKTDLSLISDPELNHIRSLPREGEEHEEDIDHDASSRRKKPIEHAEIVDETEVKQILPPQLWEQDENPSPGGKKPKEVELDEIKHQNEETIPKKIDEQDETFGGRKAVNGERILNRRQENGRQPEQGAPPTRDSGVEGSNDLLSSLLPSNPRRSDNFVTQNGEENPSTGFPETNNHCNHQFRMPSSEMTKLLKTNPEPLIPEENPCTGFPETNNHCNHQFRMPSSEMTKLLKTNPEPLIPAEL
ncbi:hypothetical protein SNE40_016264 [Patella caerulea]|uniref:Sushi domain-containing protein n=1 Tax=Patella caerulea TaxID=87958 RepID=A0AAN8PN75_PATCE